VIGFSVTSIPTGGAESHECPRYHRLLALPAEGGSDWYLEYHFDGAPSEEWAWDFINAFHARKTERELEGLAVELAQRDEEPIFAGQRMWLLWSRQRSRANARDLIKAAVSRANELSERRHRRGR
jgi:hypothetical protein